MFDDCQTWKVVVSLEYQYSIWPNSKVAPPGWKDEGKIDSKEGCLNYIKEVWLDMRPKSLQELTDL